MSYEILSFLCGYECILISLQFDYSLYQHRLSGILGYYFNKYRMNANDKPSIE